MGLSRRVSTNQKPVDDHCFSFYHLSTWTDLCILGINWLGSCWLGYLHQGFKLSNGCVISTALRHTFGRVVSHRCKILSSSIFRVEVSGFTNCQRGREEIGVPNINVWKEWAIHQQSLAERLLGRIHRVAVEYQVGCSELSICVHKDL